MSRRVHFVMPDELVARVDKAAGGLEVSRGEFVRRALESALGDGERKLASPAPTRLPPIGASATDAYLRTVHKSYGLCPDCGKANGVHKGDCPAHPRAGR